jgi:hypothetical protein
MKLESEALRLARQKMELDFGGIDKVPAKIQDIVTSFYYHFHIFYRDVALNHGLPPAMFKGTDSKAALKKWIKDVAYWKSSMSVAPKQVRLLIDLARQPEKHEEFNLIADYICDDLIYGGGAYMNWRPSFRKAFLLFKRRFFKVIPGIANIKEL